MDKVINAVLAGVADGAALGLVALGIVLVYKATRVLNFAQAEIGTMALYVAWELTEVGTPIVLAVIVALAVASAMGAGTEYLLRPLAEAPRLTVTVATLGLATFIGFGQIPMFGVDPHILPPLISGPAFQIGRIQFLWGHVLALMATAGLGISLFVFFKRTLFGLGVLAAAQDQTALKLMGLPFNQVSVFTWASGAVLTALAALILVPTIGAFAPFFITQSIFIPALAAALVGGLTSLPGAFVGGIVIGITQNVAKFYAPSVPGAEFMAVVAALIAVLLFKPNGLLGAEA